MLKKILKSKKISALLVTKKENIGYLSNFWGSSGLILITPKTIKLFTDSRYLAEAEKTVFPNVEIYDYQELKSFLKNKIIGYESNSVTVLQLKNWKKTFPQTKFRFTENLIEKSRISKTETELQKIQKATQINDKILTEIKTQIKIGISEYELQWKIRELAFQFGADKMAFKTIVNFAKHTAHPHHEADNTKLKKGDLILIDLGTRVERYCSDITRVFFTKEPTAKEKEIFQIVKTAQANAIQKVSQTTDCKKIDTMAREHILKNGYGNYFGHSLGHGVGLNIHESPNLSPLSKEKLTENTVFTIEPGIYLPGEFGIRIEDLFVYQEKKAVRLSHFTKKIEDLILFL